MDNFPQDNEEYKRQMAQRRRNNTIALLGIGVIIIILVALSSGSTVAVFGLIGIFIIVGILVAIRSWLERRYQRRKAAEPPKNLEGDEKDSV